MMLRALERLFKILRITIIKLPTGDRMFCWHLFVVNVFVCRTRKQVAVKK